MAHGPPAEIAAIANGPADFEDVSDFGGSFDRDRVIGGFGPN